MVEQRVPYHALSSDEQSYGGRNATLPRKREGSTTPASDSILLLPLCQSTNVDEADVRVPCLHLVRLPDARLGLCNVLTEQRCACCNCPLCEQHQSAHGIAFPDAQGISSDAYMAPLCETCALLPGETLYALHVFVLAINSQGIRVSKGEEGSIC